MSTQEMDQSAIDSLFRGSKGEQKAEPVNFALRRGLTADQMKTLSSINLQFTRSLSTNLSSWLEADISVSMIAAERLLYRAHLSTFDPEAMYLGEGRFRPLNEPALIQMDVACVQPIVHLGLGGRPETLQPPAARELTMIDTAILEVFLETFWREMNRIWSQYELEAAFERRIMAPDVHKVFPHSEDLLSFTYAIEIAGTEGILQLSLASGVAGLLLRQMDSQDAKRTQSPEVAQTMRERLGELEQELHLRLPSFQMSVAALRELCAGMVLDTKIPAGDRLMLKMDGGPQWAAQAMTRNNRLVARIVAP